MQPSPLDYEGFFHAAMATIPSSILIFDEQLAVLTVNRTFLDKSQGTLETTRGRRLHEIFPAAFQDTALDQQIRDVIVNGSALHRRRMTYRAPGIPFRIYSYSICPLQLRGGAPGAILVMDDVTDHLRLSEEVRRTQLHLASVVESARDLIVSTDPLGAIMTWNSAAELATGFSQDEVRGRLLADQIEPPQNVEVADCFRQTAQIADLHAVEWSTRCRHGRAIPVSWHLSSMTDTAGQVTGMVVVGRNLSGQRALEAQVRQAEKLAALGMAISGIAHEIRNPLGVSSAAAQLMRHRAGSPELIEECIGKVISGIDRASLVVESLLSFARPGPLRETARVDLVEVMNNALLFASGEAASNTTVDYALSRHAESASTQGVENLLELVMTNLILNAFQAMPGGGRLSIRLRSDAPDVVIEIGDSGPGIPEANVTKIFDPFFTTGGDKRHSGLGLSVSHSIVHQHGGSLTLRTSLQGTVFTVRLPATHDDSASARAGS